MNAAGTARLLKPPVCFDDAALAVHVVRAHAVGERAVWPNLAGQESAGVRSFPTNWLVRPSQHTSLWPRNARFDLPLQEMVVRQTPNSTGSYRLSFFSHCALPGREFARAHAPSPRACRHNVRAKAGPWPDDEGSDA